MRYIFNILIFSMLYSGDLAYCVNLNYMNSTTCTWQNKKIDYNDIHIIYLTDVLKDFKEEFGLTSVLVLYIRT